MQQPEFLQQFVDESYKRNKKYAPKRRELTSALGELAREAISKENSQLTEKFIKNFLGEPDDEESLFYLALELGWLNLINVAESQSFQRVYAFPHLSFQDYFASLAIKDLSFFLPEEHDNSDPKPVSNPYRLFEQKWREVGLFWIEQRLDNTEIFQKLDAFQDGCGGFYECTVFFLKDFTFRTNPNRLLTHIDEYIRDNEEIKELIEACEYITPDDYWDDDEEVSYDDRELTSYEDSKFCEEYDEYLNSREHKEHMDRLMTQQMQYYDDIEDEILQSFNDWSALYKSQSLSIKEDQEKYWFKI